MQKGNGWTYSTCNNIHSGSNNLQTSHNLSKYYLREIHLHRQMERQIILEGHADTHIHTHRQTDRQADIIQTPVTSLSPP